jgi:hypothetical protein
VSAPKASGVVAPRWSEPCARTPPKRATGPPSAQIQADQTPTAQQTRGSTRRGCGRMDAARTKARRRTAATGTAEVVTQLAGRGSTWLSAATETLSEMMNRQSSIATCTRKPRQLVYSRAARGHAALRRSRRLHQTGTSARMRNQLAESVGRRAASNGRQPGMVGHHSRPSHPRPSSRDGSCPGQRRGDGGACGGGAVDTWASWRSSCPSGARLSCS